MLLCFCEKSNFLFCAEDAETTFVEMVPDAASPPPASAVLGNVKCAGNESRLVDCHARLIDYNHSLCQGVKIQCGPNITNFFDITGWSHTPVLAIVQEEIIMIFASLITGSTPFEYFAFRSEQGETVHLNHPLIYFGKNQPSLHVCGMIAIAK